MSCVKQIVNTPSVRHNSKEAMSSGVGASHSPAGAHQEAHGTDLSEARLLKNLAQWLAHVQPRETGRGSVGRHNSWRGRVSGAIQFQFDPGPFYLCVLSLRFTSGPFYLFYLLVLPAGRFYLNNNQSASPIRCGKLMLFWKKLCSRPCQPFLHTGSSRSSAYCCFG